MSNKMLIDASHPEETRVVVVKGNRLEDFDFESQHKTQIRGNIYLAKVTRVEPSLQAAFVDYGGNRHGFLAFSEIHPDYYQIPLADRQALLEEEAAYANREAEEEDEEAAETEERGKRRRRRRRGRRSRDNEAVKAVPAAEPVAMDDILAAYEAKKAEEGEAESEEEETQVIAAAQDHGDTVSEDVSDDSDDEEDEDDDASEDDEDAVDDMGEGDDIEDRRPMRPSRRNYKIQEVIKRRQVILVQVVKEERGNKGAALTTYLSLAGRYSVLMPNTARGGGISRKIASPGDRKRLKEIVRNLDVPKGMGVILRTAGANQPDNEIQRDYDYLMRLWNNVRDLTLSSTAPALVYEEGSLIKRSIRDLYNRDIKEIVVSGDAGYREAKDFMAMMLPNHARAVKRWKESTPILARTGMEAELDKLIQPQVTLKSGGYLIINQTEALVAIDVNSGKSTKEHSIEETALATNLEAAEEVARQLRLRDLAGLIVIDFIDMEENRNNRAVEKKLKDCLKNDRARIQVGRISHFGLMEMSRQRIRASVLESTMQVCSACNGTGHVRSPQSVALHLIRSIEDQLNRSSRHHLNVRTSLDTVLYLLNNKRDTLSEMEARFGVKITVEPDHEIGSEMFAIEKGEVSTLPKQEASAVSMGGDHEDEAGADEDLWGDEPAMPALAQDSDNDDEDEGEERGKRRRRRRRGRKKDNTSDTAEAANAESDDDSEADDDEEDDNNGRNRRKRRRRSRGRRGGRNRRDRIPAAEPVGPLADLIAAQEAEADAADSSSDDDASDDDNEVVAEVTETKAVEAKVEVIEIVETKEVKAEIVEAEEQQVEREQSEPAPAANDDSEQTESEDGKPARKRATAANLDLDAKPVVVSDNGGEQEKPKKAGWWNRKSFF